jgi:hypothetical protein
MIKSIVVHDIPADALAAMERWYYREHSAEIVRRYGPWPARHESYLPVPAPPEAATFGVFNWRVTEGWWRELPEPGPRGALSFTPPPVWPTVATCFVPAQPSDDFAGSDSLPSATACLRWYVLVRYLPGVSVESGEEWFLGILVPEVLRQPQLRRFFSFRVITESSTLPGVWRGGGEPPADTILPTWHRLCELWYESLSDWRAATAEVAAAAAPPWAELATFPFVEPGRNFVSSFILERPTDEFLRDLRAYPS